ncbi:hypothetical protein [Arsukibacterium sp. UBA3155]|uniref:hypothetical protein n=1 Tax=Arsukibacterium sp. UBA3155 TaxID=1946058 RepID=UPI0025BCE933|nr:hypothetical protein [Arsukibacterium sp. UBA3155]
MSWEGLADAVVKLRNLAEANESALQGAFSFMGNWSAAAGNLPPTPAEGTGSQMYRISSAGTMAGRAYRVGEHIFYDQFTSQWRSTVELASPFSTSLLANSDIASWKAALEIEGALPAPDNIDTLVTPGRYFGPGASGVGYPGSTTYGFVRVTGKRNAVVEQEASFINSELNESYTRSGTDDGLNWTPFIKNINAKDVTASNTDNTRGRMLKVGDGGLMASLELRGSIYSTGTPADMYSRGTAFGFAAGGELQIPGLGLGDYGVLEAGGQWTDGSGGYASAYRKFTINNTIYIQQRASDTTWTTWTRLLKVGDGGLMRNDGLMLSEPTPPENWITGLYGTNASWASSPYPGVDGNNQGYMITLKHPDPTYGMQIWGSLGLDDLRIRRMAANTVENWKSVTLVEKGSNANGIYSKYSDGLLICSKNYNETTNVNVAEGALYRNADGIVWTFPHPFLVGYPVTLTGQFPTTGAWLSQRVQGAVNQAIYYWQAALPLTGDGVADICAVGRWKV